MIAAASFRAIRQGGSLRATLEVARRLRPQTDAPLVLFSYYNPIFTFGDVALIEAAAAAGVDALLVVDLPPEWRGGRVVVDGKPVQPRDGELRLRQLPAHVTVRRR